MHGADKAFHTFELRVMNLNQVNKRKNVFDTCMRTNTKEIFIILMTPYLYHLIGSVHQSL